MVRRRPRPWRAASRRGTGDRLLLTAAHGRWLGVVPGGNSRARRHLLQQGTRVAAAWRARHAGQLGTLSCELAAAVPVRIITDRFRLAALTAAAALLDAVLPEREPNAPLYQATLVLIAHLSASEDWLGAYAAWESRLIADIGFGDADDRRSADPAVDAGARLSAHKAALARNAHRLEDSVFAAGSGRMPFARAHLGRLLAEVR